MPLPGTLGTNTANARMGVRIGVEEAVAANVTATALSSTTGAATINAAQGIITSPNLTTSLNYSLTVTNSLVSSTDIVWVSVQNGTNTAAVALSPGLVTVSNGTFSVVLNNTNTTAHNGTVQIAFQVLKMMATADQQD